MERKFKFDVGDKVWIVEYDSWNKWYVKGKFTVESLTFRKDSIAESICYGLEGIPVNVGEPLAKSEIHCFTTQAEAQAECDKRNKDNKR